MGIGGKLGYVFYTVARSLSRTKLICAYVYSIGAMVNGNNALLKVFGRSKEFDRAGRLLLEFIMYETCFYPISSMLYGVS